MSELTWERFEAEDEDSAWKLGNDDLWYIWIYDDGTDPFTVVIMAADLVGSDIEDAQFHLIGETYADWKANKLPWQTA